MGQTSRLSKLQRLDSAVLTFTGSNGSPALPLPTGFLRVPCLHGPSGPGATLE